MRLINANRAISKVDEIPVLTDKNQAFFEGCRYMKKRVLKIIRTSKTIDAVPVVRCGECKHWATEAIDEDGWCENPDGLDNIAKQTDFCSYGERKDGEG